MPEGPPDSLRLFVAIPAPPEIVTSASATIGRLRGAGDVRWVTPERLHLTLKFLGATPAEKVPAIREALGKSANNVSRFVVRLGSAGAFPNVRRPQTLWIGFSGSIEPLATLAGQVEDELGPLGFPPEGRAFRPHLTIGRVRSGKGLSELAGRLQQVAGDPRQPGWDLEWRVDELHLVQSVLRPSGPEYTTLERFPLGAR